MTCKAECVIYAQWTSNRQNEKHALFVVETAQGPSVVLFEGSQKLLQGHATISQYSSSVQGGVEIERWQLRFDPNVVSGYEVDVDQVINRPKGVSIAAAVRQQSMRLCVMQVADIPLGRIPLPALLTVSDKEIEEAIDTILRGSSQAKVILNRLAA